MPLTNDVAVRRKTGVQAEATRQRQRTILDAALAAFTEVGYNAASLRDVAARAGISHTGLLHHFPDKPGLLEAVLDGLIGDTSTEFGFGSSDGTVVMRALIAATERDIQDPALLRFHCLVTAEALNPSHPAHGYMKNWHRTVHQRLTEAFTDLEARGLYLGAPLTPRDAAVQASALRDGAITTWLLDPAEVDLVAAVKASLQRFVALDT